jgi:DHA1 family multidrug resistance protein-like MFS transporter
LNRDVKTTATVSAVFGLCSGAFGMLFTLYLDSQHVSLYAMGAMFSISAFFAFLIAVLLGAQSDLWGRRIVYSASLLLASLSSFCAPMLRSFLELTMSRISQDIAIRSREAVHHTFIYEHVKQGYAKVISRIQGLELTLNAVGYMIAGSMLLYLGFHNSFIALGLMLIIALVIFQTTREPSRPKSDKTRLRDRYRFDISKQLKILCLFNLIQNIGFAICHSVFIFTLFFLKKFSIDALTLSAILGIHHFTYGVPLIIVSRFFSKPNLNYKKVFMFGNLMMGIPHIVAAFVPSLLPAAAVWFIHDVFGAAFYGPAQQTLTQIHSRDCSRGKDVNMTSAFTSIGLVIGPVIGGYLAGIDINFPFLVGGAIITSATLVIAFLDPKSSSP